MSKTLLQQRISTILRSTQYAAVATICTDQTPWNTPLSVVVDKGLNFYWVSWTENTHSRNIDANGKAFVVMFDSSVPDGTGDAIYLSGTATRINTLPGIKKALLTMSRHGGSGLNPSGPSKYHGDMPRRVYVFTPESCWVNDEGAVAGNYIDVRREVAIQK